jgi:hypothetical protein
MIGHYNFIFHGKQTYLRSVNEFVKVVQELKRIPFKA